MKQMRVKGKIENAHGKALRELKTTNNVVVEGPLFYDAPWEAFTTIEEVKEKGKMPSESQIVKLMNAQQKNNARSAAITAKLDENNIIKPTTENDAQLRLKVVFDALISAYPADKRQDEATIAECRARASAAANVDWDEDDE